MLVVPPCFARAETRSRLWRVVTGATRAALVDVGERPAWPGVHWTPLRMGNAVTIVRVAGFTGHFSGQRCGDSQP